VFAAAVTKDFSFATVSLMDNRLVMVSLHH